MANASGLARRELARILAEGRGLPRPLTVNAAADALEKSTAMKYPALYVYCERATNAQVEKFRRYSGPVELSAEIRVSHEHAAELHEQLELYVEAVTNVLDEQRGSWAAGVHYGGGYEVAFAQAKRGGRGFVQAARVRVQVHVSLD